MTLNTYETNPPQFILAESKMVIEVNSGVNSLLKYFVCDAEKGKG